MNYPPTLRHIAGRTTSYDLIHRKHDPLPAFDFGGALRVDGKELDLWVERHRMGAA